jgi:ferredoxin-type protein NapH
MNDLNATPASRAPGLGKMVLLCLPMALLTFVMLSGGGLPRNLPGLFTFAVTYLGFNALFFMMIRTGVTDRYRAVIFVTFSVCFVISFISHLIEARGTMALTSQTMLAGGTPFCHMVIPMILIPLAVTKTVIFPGTIIGGFASVASMLALWLGATLVLGRGFCGWFCFFGGLEDGFSRIFRRPVIKRINPKWRYLPFGVLAVVVISAAVTLSPTYCEWLCPFKAVTEFNAVTSTLVLVQTVIFVSLFAGLVVTLPLLTKRRVQCAVFCPFGAFQSLANKINVFSIRIDREKCVKCRKCIQACPVLSLDDRSLETGKPLFTCLKCGKCVDVCPAKAVRFHVMGTPLSHDPEIMRRLFLYPAFLILATMAGGNIQDAVVRIISFVTTGSFIK